MTPTYDPRPPLVFNAYLSHHLSTSHPGDTLIQHLTSIAHRARPAAATIRNVHAPACSRSAVAERCDVLDGYG
jgi:hypothetical protein